MTFLLDTCTFLWLSDQTENLSERAREVLVDRANTLVVSQISFIEIQIKYAKGKLPLKIPPQRFIAESMARHHLEDLHLKELHVWTIGKLPPIHQDPFDRLLISQAIEEGLVIVTPDPKIHPYPVRCLW